MIFTFPPSIQAQEEFGALRNIFVLFEEEDLVVTPSRLDQRLSEIPASVTIVASHEIDAKNPIGISDVLRNLPGVRLFEEGTLGETTTVTLRGSEPTQTLILLEGVRLTNPFRGRFNIGNFLIDEIQQIEIVKGPQSALYGSDAIGGVVNLRTRRAKAPLEVSFLGEVGAEESYRGAFSISGENSWIDFSLTLSGTQTNGQFDHDFFQASAISGYIGIPLRNYGRLDYIYRFQDDHKELGIDIVSVAPFTIQALPDVNSEREQKLLFHSVQYQNSIGRRLGLNWKLSFIDFYDDWDNPMDPGSPLSIDYFEDTKTDTWILDFQQDIWVTPFDTFTFGVEQMKEIVDSEIVVIDGSFPIERTRRNTGYYFQNLFNWQKRLFLQVGVRIDDNSDFETSVNPKASTAYEIPNTKTRLRGSWGKGFHAPPLLRQFFPVFGNPSLEPEKAMSWEVGLQRELMEKKMVMDVALFRFEYTDLIQFSAMGAENIGEARILGVETSLTIHPIERLTTQFNYTYLDTKDDRGQALDFRARHHGNVILLFSPIDGLSINLYISLISDQTLGPAVILVDGRTRTDESPGYVRADLSATYHLFDGFPGFRETRFFIKFRNLFDEDYEELTIFPAPRFGFSGGLKIIF